MSPHATQHCVAGNPLPATYSLSRPDIGYHTLHHTVVSEIMGPSASHCEVYCLLECEVAYSNKRFESFIKWKQTVSPKRWHQIYSTLHNVLSQKTVIFICDGRS
jgi:hypothetical protein